MSKERKNTGKYVNIVFTMLLIGAFIWGGLWYYFSSLKWQNDDPPIGYLFGFPYLCCHIFFMVVNEIILWRNILCFPSVPKDASTEGFCRILLMVLAFIALVTAASGLCGENFASGAGPAILLVISVFQIICRCVIGRARAAAQKQTDSA